MNFEFDAEQLVTKITNLNPLSYEARDKAIVIADALEKAYHQGYDDNYASAYEDGYEAGSDRKFPMVG